ncbi:MAG TPA: aldo/keto reductase [Verrucomicrobiales bacterium]|nr:aldo/keto reductase [Verrucomicrobiales bacterium]
MQQVPLGTSSLRGSRLAYGCWRIAGTWNPAEATSTGEAEGRRAVQAAYDAGFTLFDHADIYCQGLAETLFGRVLKATPGMRQRIIIASKCGIRPKDTPTPGAPARYDFSAEHIIQSCEGSLRRLGIETLDLYQLHRPDYLMDPAEVASAFTRLQREGKVREFGVSNFRPSQLSALQHACPMPLIVNQVEISLSHLDSLEDGTLDQALSEGITPMAWSPLGGGHLADGPKRVLPSQEGYRSESLLTLLDGMASDHGVDRATLSLAWLLRHPAGIVPIVGSTHPERIQTSTRALGVQLSREEWYRLFTAARGRPLA